MNLLKKWVFVLAAAACGFAFSLNTHAMEAPDALVKRISQDVMESAKKNKEIKKGNQKQIFSLVETKVFPYVNFQRMTSLAAGKYWRQATEAQRAQLTKEFRDLLVHTYSSALAKVDDYQIQYRPFRAAPGAKDVIVYSRLIPTKGGGEPIELSYRMEQQADSWKIYDINVLGAWLVETYKGTFASEIGRSGIDGLIRSLADKNKALAQQGK